MRAGVTVKLGASTLCQVKIISFLPKLIIAGSLFGPSAFSQQEQYPVHPDSKKQDGVPSGKVTQAKFADSTVYPGTNRDYWIYVPAQYKPGQLASLMVFQDGEAYVNSDTFNALDNLIHRGEIPVMIGVLVNPGVVPAQNENAQARFNRSLEYDDMSHVGPLLGASAHAVAHDVEAWLVGKRWLEEGQPAQARAGLSRGMN